MPNELTGDFDVVAEFPAGAVNRVLAAMHRGLRFPHSLSVRVDNTPRSRGTFPVTTVFGEALTSRMAVAASNPGGPPRGAATSSTSLARLLTQVLDPVVNVGGIYVPPPVPNPLHGVAQLQLGAPTVSLPANAHNQATVHMPVMAQYFPDQNTTPLQQFLYGEFQITFAATEVVSAAGTFIHVDLAQPGGIHFQSAQPLDPTSNATIDAALSASIATGFVPSNTAMPSTLAGLQIFTLPQQGAVAILMSLPGGQPPPGPPLSFTSVFLDPADQFAIAVSADFLAPSITAALNSALDPYRHLHFEHDTSVLVGTIVVRADVTIGPASLAFLDGSMLLTVIASVAISGDLGSYSDTITLTQAFTLGLSAGQVSLDLQGDLQVNNSSTLFSIFDWLFGSITNGARTAFLNAWNGQQANIQSQVGSKLSSATLQGFLRQLMNPVSQQTPPPEEVDPTLAFIAVEVRKAGVVLHGSLAVPPWPPVDVEFELVPNTATMQHPEYNALNSWIPGGAIQSYVWTYTGQAMPADATKFVSTNAPALNYILALHSVCLTPQGSRVSSSGPIVMQAVSGESCQGVLPGNTMAVAAQTQPDMGLTGVSAGGGLEFVGHVSPWAASGARTGTVNLLVHFPDEKSLSQLGSLRTTLQSSGRPDADTTILAVLAADQINKVKSPGGLAFADDDAGWKNRLEVKQRPATVLLGPDGKTLWRHDGDLSGPDLAEALRKNLSARSYFTPRLLRMPLKVGLRAPNFVFKYSPGREVILRKLTARRVLLVFWKSSSRASLDTLAVLEKALAKQGTAAPVLLAIGTGEGGSNAASNESGAKTSAMIIPDPNREISDAYGVGVWPTTIYLDAQGVIQDIRYGLITEAATKGMTTPLQEQTEMSKPE